MLNYIRVRYQNDMVAVFHQFWILPVKKATIKKYLVQGE